MAASSTYISHLSDPNASPAVVVFSIDKDGALLSSLVSIRIKAQADLGLPFRKDYETLSKDEKDILKQATINALEKAHPELIKHILSLIPDGATAYFISGSNRQTRARDLLNGMKSIFGNDNGSSFIALQAFVEIITTRLAGRATAILDKMLLEDFANQKSPGTFFDSALERGCATPLPTSLNEHEVGITDSNTEFDDAKRLLLYTQMHYFAAKHPSTAIAFHFYDDDANPATHKQILASLQLFFGQQVLNGICTFLDNCADDMIFKINITRQHILEAQEPLPAESETTISQATVSAPGTEIAQSKTVDTTTANIDILSELATFKELMLKYIMQLKADFQAFQTQHTQENICAMLRSQLLEFQSKQESATHALKAQLITPETSDASVRKIFYSARSVPPSDLVIEISVLLHLFLLTPPDQLPMRLSAKDAITRILKVLAKPQMEATNKIPANIHLHLHKYVGPNEFEPNALLVNKSVIYGVGMIDGSCARNYCAISQELIAASFHRMPSDGQASLCRYMLNKWHTATTTQQPLPEVKLPAFEDILSPSRTQKRAQGSALERFGQSMREFFTSGSGIFSLGSSSKGKNPTRTHSEHRKQP